MKIAKQLLQALLLYGIFLVGGWLQNTLHIPLSGSIIGLLLLWIALSLKIIHLKWVESGAYLFLSLLPLFFIPATVGVMNFGPFFMGKGIVLIPITIISTFMTLWIASFVSQSIAKHTVKRKEESECN
ncbi:CidA/LrgA family holin-like protein [Sporosarcina limicola]|uniref:Holin-like protein n=1 Tax=Sporosarcina limicola TaxID=34101 RepID=A0A927R5P2_9BACL|nr:CidA/LrgA family holin-like protein [Sporosarcina limicola]MBE1556278.1 holin-like protein [Sporosarcina limicola]